MRRLLVLLFLTIGLAPGTWWRSAGPPHDEPPALEIIEIEVGLQNVGAFQLLGAWELRSSNSHFHGYSGLVSMGDGTLLAISDRGRRLRFTRPDKGGGTVEMGLYAADGDKRMTDIEAITRDPLSGRLWAAYEFANAIERQEADGTEVRRVAPHAMAHWSDNAGPESMVRLNDGRFIVIAEGRMLFGKTETEALLFPGDPVEGADPLMFSFAHPRGYRPVDMAQLPDGRVLILTRAVEWGLPPRFSSQLILADPADIVAGRIWQGTIVAEIGAPVPSDNYEGIAIEPEPDGSAIVWLISDDNQSAFQRTLLLKLRWPAQQKSARNVSRALMLVDSDAA